MAAYDFKSIIDRLNQQGQMIFQSGATDIQIASFETDHNIVLPSKFKEFLKFSDGGEFFLPAGVQIYGVAQKPFIDVEDNDRPSDSYIVIGALASGDPVLCEKTSERISIYNHEAGRIESDEVFSDFTSFLDELHDLLGIEG